METAVPGDPRKIQISTLKCDVCGEPAVGVACSSTGPVSFAYCSKCLRENREPYWAIVASVIGMERLDQVAEWYRPIVLLNLKVEGKTVEDLFADAKKAWEEARERERKRSTSKRGRCGLFSED